MITRHFSKILYITIFSTLLSFSFSQGSADDGPPDCIATCGQGIDSILGDDDPGTFCGWLNGEDPDSESDNADLTQCTCSAEDMAKIN